MKTTLRLDGDDLIEHRQQDVEPHLEYVKQLRSAGLTGTSEMKHAAHFPVEVVEAYKKQAGIDHHEFMVNPTHIRRMLSDPALGGFRNWQGKTRRA